MLLDFSQNTHPKTLQPQRPGQKYDGFVESSSDKTLGDGKT